LHNDGLPGLALRRPAMTSRRSSRVEIVPTGKVLGARVHGADLSKPLSETEFGTILGALGRYSVLCIPGQTLEAGALKDFAGRFGELEINVAAGPFCDPAHPEVMILSNIKENGKAIGLADAGQDWHTDMSYSSTIAFANVLYAIKVPRRNGKALGSTEFASMRAAYEDRTGTYRRAEASGPAHDADAVVTVVAQRVRDA